MRVTSSSFRSCAYSHSSGSRGVVADPVSEPGFSYVAKLEKLQDDPETPVAARVIAWAFWWPYRGISEAELTTAGGLWCGGSS